MTRVRFSRRCVSCGVRFVSDWEYPEPPQRYCSEDCERDERQAAVRKDMRRAHPTNDHG